MHCGCSVHLDSSACVLLHYIVGVRLSGVWSLRARSPLLRLALARLNRMQVVVGALLAREGRAADYVLGSFRLPVPAAVLIFSGAAEMLD